MQMQSLSPSLSTSAIAVAAVGDIVAETHFNQLQANLALFRRLLRGRGRGRARGLHGKCARFMARSSRGQLAGQRGGATSAAGSRQHTGSWWVSCAVGGGGEEEAIETWPFWTPNSLWYLLPRADA